MHQVGDNEAGADMKGRPVTNSFTRLASTELALSPHSGNMMLS
jgi:hypothetical protein